MNSIKREIFTLYDRATCERGDLAGAYWRVTPRHLATIYGDMALSEYICRSLDAPTLLNLPMVVKERDSLESPEIELLFDDVRRAMGASLVDYNVIVVNRETDWQVSANIGAKKPEEALRALADFIERRRKTGLGGKLVWGEEE